MVIFRGQSMKFQSLIGLLILSTLIVGCNEVGSSRNTTPKTPTTTVTPPIETSTTTYSGIHRERGTAPITYEKETELGPDAANFRRIPDMQLDDDGADGVNVSTRTFLGRPTILCGVTPVTLAEKIADCALATKNGDKATWSGKINAGSAEAEWSLVSLNGANEVWLDKRTGMLWSSIVENATNWCKASGSITAVSNSIGIACNTLGAGLSVCTNFSLPELPKVDWRLPSRQDYLQADIDGIRFVLSRGSNTFWSATSETKTVPRDKAWTFDMHYGVLTAELMSSARHVRCIGTANF